MAVATNLARQGTDPATSIILPPLHNHPARLKLPFKEQRNIGAALNAKVTDHVTSWSSGVDSYLVHWLYTGEGRATWRNKRRLNPSLVVTARDRRNRLIVPSSLNAAWPAWLAASPTLNAQLIQYGTGKLFFLPSQ
ncbi:hypothetical protein PGT21_010098 [Puccinia graminis f. sp. tritici]|uniref:Uncharacterized protein n=1 Tax=Puccinia graminis f. sp. tritici TaxID=56615 RepID=A0A5B0MTJ5_PUCGR|nr:hypothetical protein PGT21_010098 [Puccinia graminis f. sp. tritici]